MRILPVIPSLLIIAASLPAQTPHETIRALRAREKANPADPALAMPLALAYYAAGQKILFTRYAERAALVNPKDPEPHYALGRYALDDLQQQDAAARHFREALRRHPEHAPSLYHLGWCLELDNKPAEAKALYVRADTWLAHLGLARLALEDGRMEEALLHAKKGAAAAEPSAHMALARVLLRVGRNQEALVSLRQAARLDPADARIHYQISRVAAGLGDPVLERESLARYQELRAIYTQR
jgi:Flp pilus assembly protein TadD